MLSEAVGEVETSKNEILRLRYRSAQDDIALLPAVKYFRKGNFFAKKGFPFFS